MLVSRDHSAGSESHLPGYEGWKCSETGSASSGPGCLEKHGDRQDPPCALQDGLGKWGRSSREAWGELRSYGPRAPRFLSFLPTQITETVTGSDLDSAGQLRSV